MCGEEASDVFENERFRTPAPNVVDDMVKESSAWIFLAQSLPEGRVRLAGKATDVEVRLSFGKACMGFFWRRR